MTQPTSVRAGSILALAAMSVLATGLPARAAVSVKLDLKVIYAHNQGKHIDEELEGLAKELGRLSFTAYELKDRASFELEMGTSVRMQLPNGAWMVIHARDLAPDGKLRLDIQVQKLKFKTTVSIAPGATLAVGGPRHERGALILALTRPKAG